MYLELVSTWFALKVVAVVLCVFIPPFRRLSLAGLHFIWSLVVLAGVMKLWAAICRTSYEEDPP